MAAAFQQFIAFGTDIVGIERALRLFQSICHIILSYPLLQILLLPSTTPKSLTSSTHALTALRSQINVSRRFIRLFRFLDTFHAGWLLYVAEEKSLETWLDIVGKTCLGVYGFLESATMLDVLGIQGLNVWGVERSREMNLQSQVFWFSALYCSVVGSGIKLFKVFAHQAVPKNGEGYGTGEKPGQKPSETEKLKPKETPLVSDKELSQEDELKEERERLKGVVAKRKAERRAWIREVSTQVTSLGKKMLSDTIDMILPTAGAGWINVHPGVVGIAMFTTTIITGLDVWHRCGRDLAKKNA
ncbi:Fc.00g113280.m01.CDS01 [Cosmosporella sp. VM-42]